MSGICGVVSLDGAPPDPSGLRAVLQALERRGPDGSNIWSEGPAVLGHALLATTPESLSETLPFVHAESGCTITADARLDNRDDLFSALGLSKEGRIVGDGELILRAYLKWGEACAEHLLGDFAFAIWDGKRRRMFCVRDQMGMRQLAFCHLPGRAFLFATEPSALLRHGNVPSDVNDGRIAEYLDGLEASDLSETFYSAVSRLPPAHSLSVSVKGVEVRRYWELRAPPALKLKSDAEYEDAFLEAFTTAVRARLRSVGQVGAMLSGGMDSSSIAAVAAKILDGEGRGPLPTFSAVGPDPASCIETRTIHAAARMAGIDPQFVNFADLDGYRDELVRLTRAGDDPFDGHMVLIRAVYLAAHRAGIKVVLDGAGGDLVLGSTTYIPRLLRQGRFLGAWREARGKRDFWGLASNPWRTLAVDAWRAWAPRSLRMARRRRQWSRNDGLIGTSGPMSRDFTGRAGLVDRRNRLRAQDELLDRFDGQERARRVAHANLVVGRERYDRVASPLAIEPRDPFLDLRLIDFCLSVPLEQLQAGGWPKMILRRSMAEKLPDEVRWRRGKDHLGWTFTKALFASPELSGVPRLRLRETIGDYIHLDHLDARSPGSADDDVHCKARLDAICLHHWIESARGLNSDRLDPGGNRS